MRHGAVLGGIIEVLKMVEDNKTTAPAQRAKEVSLQLSESVRREIISKLRDDNQIEGTTGHLFRQYTEYELNLLVTPYAPFGFGQGCYRTVDCYESKAVTGEF
jgi:hypothetical protein